ncbi:MAG: hypothetical protein RR359_02125 [Bacilli bacterium]
MNNNAMMPYNMMPFPGSQPAFPGPQQFPGNQPAFPGPQLFPGMNNNDNCNERLNRLERDVNRLERQVKRLDEKVNNLSQIPMPINNKDNNYNDYPNNMYMM